MFVKKFFFSSAGPSERVEWSHMSAPCMGIVIGHVLLTSIIYAGPRNWRLCIKQSSFTKQLCAWRSFNNDFRYKLQRIYHPRQ